MSETHPFLISRRDLEAIEATNRETTEYIESRRRDVLPEGSGRQVVYTAEVAFGAFGMGVLYGRYGDFLARSPVPVDLLLGLAGHGFAFYFERPLGDVADHIHALSDGCIASAAKEAGLKSGAQLRERAAPAPAVAGVPRQMGARSAVTVPNVPTEAELAARIHRYRRAA